MTLDENRFEDNVALDTKDSRQQFLIFLDAQRTRGKHEPEKLHVALQMVMMNPSKNQLDWTNAKFKMRDLFSSFLTLPLSLPFPSTLNSDPPMDATNATHQELYLGLMFLSARGTLAVTVSGEIFRVRQILSSFWGTFTPHSEYSEIFLCRVAS